MGGSWWRGLTEHGLLEKEMATHSSVLALKPHEQYGKPNDRILKEKPQVSRCPICYWRSVEK